MAKTNLDIIINAKDNASGTIGRLGGALDGLGNIATRVATIGLAAVAGGVAALGAGLVSSIGQAMEAQDGLAELNAVIASTGGIAGITAAEAEKLASSFQGVTRFSDDAILAGESMLLTFTNIGSNVFPEATEAMLNMAQKFGSIEAASVQLGKALNDPVDGVTALRRVGVMLTDAQEATIEKMVALGDVAGAQKVILSELETEFGGLAVAAGSTAAGKFDILKNKIGDVQEQIGGAFLPVLTLAADKLSTWVDSPGFQAGVDTITKGIGSIIEVITPLADGNAILALHNLQKELMSFGVDPKAIEGITDLLTGNLFGKEMMTPGGMVETGGLLRAMGLSDEDVASTKESMDTISREAERIGESFSKIFAAGTGESAEGGNALVQLLENVAWAMEKIAAAGDVAAQIRAISDALGGGGAATNEIFKAGTGIDIAGTRASQISQQGLVQTGQGSPNSQANFDNFMKTLTEFLGRGSLAADAFGGQGVTVNVTLDGKEIAKNVSATLGSQAQALSRQGGYNPR